MNLAVIVIVAVALALSFTAGTAGAKQVQVEQEIKPIECIYTQTQTGSTVTTSDNCPNMPIPSVIGVSKNNGRPMIRGWFSSMSTRTLRVWLNGQWYTQSVDSRLTTDGDSWSLDLSDLAQPLPPGEYEVTVETLTHDGYLLRRNNAWRFMLDVPPAPNPTDTPGASTGDMPTPTSGAADRPSYAGLSYATVLESNPESLTFLQTPERIYIDQGASDESNRGIVQWFVALVMAMVFLAIALWRRHEHREEMHT